MWIFCQRFLSTPSARRATLKCFFRNERRVFLSTPSARRATSVWYFPSTFLCNFYPRPPRGGRPQQRAAAITVADFYPRPPRGGRPVAALTVDNTRIISIHALREEGDDDSANGDSCPLHFYPRPPRGGRRVCVVLHAPVAHFYPRPPRGGRPAISACPNR